MSSGANTASLGSVSTAIGTASIEAGMKITITANGKYKYRYVSPSGTVLVDDEITITSGSATIDLSAPTGYRRNDYLIYVFGTKSSN